MSDSKCIKIDELSVRIKLQKDTMELFSVPLPRCQQLVAFGKSTQVRILDNPLEESLRNYAAWGRLKVSEKGTGLANETVKFIKHS